MADAQQIVLRRKDASGLFASGITNEIEQKCLELGITYSYKDAYIEEQNRERIKPLSLGRTELGRLVVATDGNINGTTLQIPTTGYHTAEETASLASISAVINLLMSYV
jgi:putative aminopeptidase FrvX